MTAGQFVSQRSGGRGSVLAVALATTFALGVTAGLGLPAIASRIATTGAANPASAGNATVPVAAQARPGQVILPGDERHLYIPDPAQSQTGPVAINGQVYLPGDEHHLYITRSVASPESGRVGNDLLQPGNAVARTGNDPAHPGYNGYRPPYLGNVTPTLDTSHPYTIQHGILIPGPVTGLGAGAGLRPVTPQPSPTTSGGGHGTRAVAE